MHRSDVSLFLFFFWLSLGDGECGCRDEIQRIKAGNPDISHREAFSAAAKNVSGFLPSSIAASLRSFSFGSFLCMISGVIHSHSRL